MALSYDSSTVVLVDTIIMVSIPLGILFTIISGLDWIRWIGRTVYRKGRTLSAIVFTFFLLVNIGLLFYGLIFFLGMLPLTVLAYLIYCQSEKLERLRKLLPERLPERLPMKKQE
jgi:ABC-type phosphate/phosphonate transport system permease subunit